MRPDIVFLLILVIVFLIAHVPNLINLFRDPPMPKGTYKIVVDYDPTRRWDRHYRAQGYWQEDRVKYRKEAYGDTRKQALREIQRKLVEHETHMALKAKVTSESFTYRGS